MPKTSKKKVNDIEAFTRQLQAHGMKATAQRLAVHKVMMELVHGSADMVYERLSASGEVKISRTSIYNILSDLADNGIYKRRLSANNKMYFDVNNFKHIHLYDSVNNEFRDVLDDELLEEVEARIKGRRFRGYKVDGVDLQIICHPTGRKNTMLK